MDRLSTFVAGSYNLATRIVTVEGLQQLGQVGAAIEHSASSLSTSLPASPRST